MSSSASTTHMGPSGGSTAPPPPPPNNSRQQPPVPSQGGAMRGSISDNFYQNLGHPIAGGRGRMGGSQTSLTGGSRGGTAADPSSYGLQHQHGDRISQPPRTRPASTHFMMSSSSSSNPNVASNMASNVASNMMMERPQSTTILSPGPEKPIRQYSYEIEQQDEIGMHQPTSVVPEQKPRVRFMEDSSPVQEEREEEISEQEEGEGEGEGGEDAPHHHFPPGGGGGAGARLDMLLNSNNRSNSASAINQSPPKRVSFQQHHQLQQESTVLESKSVNNNTTTNLHEENSTTISTKTSRVSFRDQCTASFNSGEEGDTTSRHQQHEQQLEGNEEGVDDDEIALGGEASGETVLNNVEDLPRRNEDPNAFISEAESLLNEATIGMSKLGTGGAGGGSAGGLSNTMDTLASPTRGLPTTTTTGHTPSVIGTQEVYRDPRQRRLQQQQQEKKMSTAAVPDGSKLSFQEKMKLFAQEAGDGTPREKAKISRAQRDIEDT
eukprot:TRINITY_DN3689_c0_g1_i10.p1 TRINITY_DN3689_c0_g1~~TRINITY_DN3689_c0_g1_i10.p1  ORF type:complete len:493 (+),score=124.72 TRINITY_DN3689_c0_g1_i10:160-1638(+)